MSEHFETPTPAAPSADASRDDHVIDLTDSATAPAFTPNPMAVEMPVAAHGAPPEAASAVAVAVAPEQVVEADPAQAFAPNPMAVDEVDEVEATEEIVDLTDDSASALDDAPIDAFDADHHKGILDRLEHELALVDAALSHIDEDEMDAAETAIKELARHNDDGQVALPLR